MNITGIKIRKLYTDGPMRAVASVTFENCFAVHDIKVIFAKEKFFIVMPSRKNNDGTYRDIAHPINAEFRKELEEAILAKFNEAVYDAEVSASEGSPDEEPLD